jgi:glucose-6-phosphate 1-epimerase
MTDLNVLIKKFNLNDQLTFSEDVEGFVMMTVKNKFATADISLYAGQVMSYTPVGQDYNLLFKSDNIDYRPGRALRGGVPICWPWFGNDYSSYGRPPHGFARNQSWELYKVEVDEDENTVVVLRLMHTDNTLAVWPQKFDLRLKVIIGKTLTMSLTTRNIDKKPLTISQALHTYFSVSNIKNVEITGLNGKPYLDKLDDFEEKMTTGSIMISEEVDRIYQEIDGPVVLSDSGYNHKVIITSKGSKTTIIWNPWHSSSKNIQDLSEHDYEKFMCVETANTAGDLVVIQPGDHHKLTTSYRISQ